MWNIVETFLVGLRRRNGACPLTESQYELACIEPGIYSVTHCLTHLLTMTQPRLNLHSTQLGFVSGTRQTHHSDSINVFSQHFRKTWETHIASISIWLESTSIWVNLNHLIETNTEQQKHVENTQSIKHNVHVRELGPIPPSCFSNGQYSLTMIFETSLLMFWGMTLNTLSLPCMFY